MLALPGATVRLAHPAALKRVALANVVGNGVPFHRIAAPATKPVPLTFRVNAGPPAVAELGLRLEIEGTGGVTAKVSALEGALAELTTVMLALPGATVRLAHPAALKRVALANVVGNGVPFHRIAAPATKPVPLTFRVNAGPPAVAELGLRLEIEGTGGVTAKVSALEGALAELTTVMLALPGATVRLAHPAALKRVALANVVGNGVPFHRIAAPATKPVPLTFRVNAGPPAVAELGLRLEIEGTGGVTAKVSALEGALAELTTVMLALPGATVRLAHPAALKRVALANVVGNGVPFHRIAAPATKPVPLTFRVNAGPPAVAELGLRLEIEGTGGVTAKVSALEGALAELTTVMLALPGATIRLADTAALKRVALANIVGNGVPFHRIAAPATKPVPLTFRVNAGPP